MRKSSRLPLFFWLAHPTPSKQKDVLIGVLFVFFGGQIDGPGLPGGLIIYQGNPFICPNRTTPSKKKSTSSKKAGFHFFVRLVHRHLPKKRDGPVAEDFNVLDFGAVGDGQTFDTAAIRLAAAELKRAKGGRLLFPAGRSAKWPWVAQPMAPFWGIS